MSDKKSAQNILQSIDSERMTRSDIRAALHSVSKDSFLDQEMKRLGFYDPDKKTEGDEKLYHIEKRIEKLEKDLSALQEKEDDVGNARKRQLAAKKERMKEAKRKRKETIKRTKEKRLAKEKKRAWYHQNEILYLGKKISHVLYRNNAELHGNNEKLKKIGLPLLNHPRDLAALLEIDIPTLRRLCFTRKISRFNSYIRFSIPKKTGGERIISAPNNELKRCQHLILFKILNQVKIEDVAHGFVRERSIKSNAEPHIGKRVVINMDMKDFFPTITFKRVRGVFVRMGYTPAIATMLAVLTTEPEITECVLDGQRWYMASGERFLPQGAPTSPAITNIICYRLDRRLLGFANSLQCSFTRYADDITFGYDDPELSEGRVIQGIKKIVEDEDFFIHPEKNKVMHNGRRKEVTGVVVNTKASVRRKDLRRFRALLHQIQKNGTEGKYWNREKYLATQKKYDANDKRGAFNYDVLTEMMGFAAYVKVVDSDKGQQMIYSVKELMDKYR